MERPVVVAIAAAAAAATIWVWRSRPCDHSTTIHAYFQAISESDLEKVLSLFAEDAVGVYPPMPDIGVVGGPVVGKSALREFYTNLLGAFPKVHSAATSVVVDGACASSPLHVEATTTGGTSFSVDNINMWKFNGAGRVSHLRVYNGGVLNPVDWPL